MDNDILMWFVYLVGFYPIFYIQNRRAKIIKTRAGKKKGEINRMEEIIKKYVNKNVVLSLADDSLDNIGEITSYSDGWITLKNKKGEEQAINCDFIIKIKEKKVKSK